MACQGTHAARSRVEEMRRGSLPFLCVLMFLCCFTTTSLAVLSSLLKKNGYDAESIGLILGVQTVPLIIASLASGFVSRRFGARQSALVGLSLLILGFIGYGLFLHSVTLLILCRFVEGIGFGLFFSPMMILAKSKLAAGKSMQQFGLFAAMVPLPNVLSPPLAELYLDTVGSNGFFFVFAIPALFSLLLIALLKDTDRSSAPGVIAQQSRITTLSALGRIRRPLYAIVAIGIAYSVVPSYMALLLIDRGIPTAFFFSVYTASLLFSRFFVMKTFETWPRLCVTVVSLIAMSVAFLVLGIGSDRATTVIAAAVFGFGYSLAYPALSLAVSSRFTEAERDIPVAWFNTIFQVAINGTPIFLAYLIQESSGAELFRLLAAFCAVNALVVAVSCFSSRRSESTA